MSLQEDFEHLLADPDFEYPIEYHPLTMGALPALDSKAIHAARRLMGTQYEYELVWEYGNQMPKLVVLRKMG